MSLLSHWKNVQPGHIIISSTGDKAKVLAVMGEVIVRSGWYNFDEAQETVTIQGCIKRGYLLKKGTKVVITKSELEKIYGEYLEIID